MANVPHSGLTGVDLHESKGVAAASANQVFAADGVGSGSFKKLDNLSLGPLGNPFGASLFHVREEETNGLGPQTPTTSGVWSTQVLNLVKTNEIAGASLSSSQISLQAGTYHIEADLQYGLSVSNGTLGVCKTRLFNTTTGSSIIDGHNETIFGTVSATGGATVSINFFRGGTMPLRGRFTLAAPSVLIFQRFFSNSSGWPSSSLGLGQGPEVYSDVLIWRIA